MRPPLALLLASMAMALAHELPVREACLSVGFVAATGVMLALFELFTRPPGG